ncbi:MAG: hypothetical protein AABZ53_00605, partial [Planctomycetota bacterium]
MDGMIYVTLARWPDGLDENGQVELLVATTGLDPFTARQRVAHGIPGVLLRTDQTAGWDMIDKLDAASRNINSTAATNHHLLLTVNSSPSQSTLLTTPMRTLQLICILTATLLLSACSQGPKSAAGAARAFTAGSPR